MMWAHLSEAVDVIALLHRKGAQLTSRDTAGLQRIKDARAMWGSSKIGLETRALLRSHHTDWNQQWHCVDTQSDVKQDPAIGQRLQDGLFEGQLAPKDFVEAEPTVTLEQFIASLDSMPMEACHKIPPQALDGNRLRVGGKVRVGRGAFFLVGLMRTELRSR
jgi:hypothetical protein